MSTLRKFFHLIEPTQPVEYWLVGTISDTDNLDEAFLARTLMLRTTAKEVKLTNDFLPSGCDSENPVAKIIVLSPDLSLVGTISLHSLEMNCPKELSNEEFFERFEKTMKMSLVNIDKLIKSIDELNTTISSFRSNK